MLGKIPEGHTYFKQNGFLFSVGRKRVHCEQMGLFTPKAEKTCACSK